MMNSRKRFVEKVDFVKEADAGIKAPHFVFFIRDYLEQKYGADAVASGGLKVITSLDYDLQKKRRIRSPTLRPV